jgi:hypothetical protein
VSVFGSTVVSVPRDRTPKADDVLIGKLAEVTGRVAPGTVGEVMVSVRGGREAFYAHPAEGETFERGTRVLIIDYRPPRTVLVMPCPEELELIEGDGQ